MASCPLCGKTSPTTHTHGLSSDEYCDVKVHHKCTMCDSIFGKKIIKDKEEAHKDDSTTSHQNDMASCPLCGKSSNTTHTHGLPSSEYCDVKEHHKCAMCDSIFGKKIIKDHHTKDDSTAVSQHKEETSAPTS
ncbi:hypothetical protein ABKN59_002710 [Abortiporus biennis]